MITPQELREKTSKLQFAKDMGNALIEVDKAINKALDKGNIRAIIPTHMELGNLYYYDDKQNAIAKELISRGFKCKRESEIIGGVKQDPIWYIYFV